MQVKAPVKKWRLGGTGLGWRLECIELKVRRGPETAGLCMLKPGIEVEREPWRAGVGDPGDQVQGRGSWRRRYTRSRRRLGGRVGHWRGNKMAGGRSFQHSSVCCRRGLQKHPVAESGGLKLRIHTRKGPSLAFRLSWLVDLQTIDRCLGFGDSPETS